METKVHNLRALLRPRRVGREERRVLSDGSSMSVWRWDVRIGPHMLENIVFFYGSEADAQDGSDPLGTGFCVWVRDDDPTKTHVYLVTNDHVVRQSAPLNVVRGNSRLTGNAVTYPTSEHDWYPHPDGDDIAVCYLGCDRPIFLASFLAAERLVRKEQVEQFYVDIGDDCLMVGCFAPHSGVKVNLPAIRFGNVSVMPHEPVYVKDRDFWQECFLVEMRSRGGFSGSPVFLVPQFEFDPVKPGFDENRDHTLGICCGHLQEWRTIKWRDPLNPHGAWIESQVEENSGMAMVIPAWKIRELLFSEDLVAERKKVEEKMGKKGGGSRTASAALDSQPSSKPGPKPETLAISGDWQEVVEKALKKGRPQR